ncbi:uncharacterized protein LOC115216288 [Octopus sinensis]|uniref:Uncharacterized protein LOC115216288 n=1 Tax=Octopus sinensis TaxID=2607531 RepID=A0A6P7SSZ2_9MOLL|nr:uncharacterized protein LOC115216288 [Octopus sinensis]
MAKTARKTKRKERQSGHSMTAECNSSDERLLRITGSRGPSWNGTKLAICTYNCRSLAGWQELNHLMEERKKIKCDVLGLCETCWKKKPSIRWQDGCTVRLGRAEGARSVGGIGFIVSKEWASRVDSCQFISSRIGVLNVNLSGKATLKIVQTYAPTRASDDDEVEEFYRQLDKGLAMKSTYTVVMGDFKAKRSSSGEGEGRHRREEGEDGAVFCVEGKTCPSLQRGKAAGSHHADWYQGDDIDDDYNSLIGKLKASLKKVKGVCPREKKGRISKETTKLLEERKNMKRTIDHHLEYSILSRVIRQQLQKDFEAYRMEKLLKAAEEKKTLKKCKRDRVLYRSEVTALKNTDGILVNVKSEMKKVCEDFYTKLFKSTRNVQPLQEENVPPILVSDVERAIGSMKNGKAPGIDGITSDVQKSGREQLWKILAERFTHYLDEGRIPS